MTKADARDLRNKDFKSLNDEVERREMTPFDAESKLAAMAAAVGFEPTAPPLKVNELRMVGHA